MNPKRVAKTAKLAKKARVLATDLERESTFTLTRALLLRKKLRELNALKRTEHLAKPAAAYAKKKA